MATKIKTSELLGKPLAYAVAVAEKFKYIHTHAPWENRYGARGGAQVMVSNTKSDSHDYDPTKYWAQGGPIIERESIAIRHNKDADYWLARVDTSSGSTMQWNWFLCGNKSKPQQWKGPTPLIAAMRCYCASKLGDEVEIPEELTC